jgi:hypothetical protein
VVDPKAAQREEELKAARRICTVTGTSGAAIAYDYKPCGSIAVREVAIGGRRDCRSLARRDNFLFVGVQGGLAVLDITDPKTAPIVNAIAMQGTELVDLVVAGDTLYAADFLNGVHAIDITDPKQPRHAAHHPALTHTNNRRVVVSDKTLVLVNDHALSIFDVSTTAQFRPLALHHRMRTAVGWLRSAVFENARLHVTQGPMGLWTFDLSDPANPRVICGEEVRLDTRPNERLIADTVVPFGERLVVGTSSGIWTLKRTDGAPESESFFTGPGTIREASHRPIVRDGQLYFCAFEPHDHILHIFDTSQGIRYMGRQRLSRMIDRIHDLEHGDGFWIGAAGNAGVLFATY